MIFDKIFRNSLRRISLLGVGLAIATAGTAFPASAEFIKYDKERLMTYPTTSEDVVLDLIKLAKIQSPEFEKMIVRTDKYRATPDGEKAGYLQDEMLRLNKKFLTLDPQKKGILVRVGVKVYFENMPDRPPSLTIKFPSEGLIYFPYYYGGLPVALLVNGIEDFQKIALTEEERQQVASVINATTDATLVLDLKPVGASVSKPLTIDGEQQFPLLCDISYIGIHNRESDQVWAWQSEESKEQSKGGQLLDLAPSKSENFTPPQ